VISEEVRNRKATKADDAPVPEYLWDRGIVAEADPLRPQKLLALGILRKFFLRSWQKRLCREFFYLVSGGALGVNLDFSCAT
jgi:hypothetical protein